MVAARLIRRVPSMAHLERVTGIEPAYSAWEADVLPLNYTRIDGRPGAAGRVARCGRQTSGTIRWPSSDAASGLVSDTVATVGENFSDFCSRWRQTLPMTRCAIASRASLHRPHARRVRPALDREHQPVVGSDHPQPERDARRAPERLGEFRVLGSGGAAGVATARDDADPVAGAAHSRRLTDPHSAADDARRVDRRMDRRRRRSTRLTS